MTHQTSIGLHRFNRIPAKVNRAGTWHSCKPPEYDAQIEQGFVAIGQLQNSRQVELDLADALAIDPNADDGMD